MFRKSPISRQQLDNTLDAPRAMYLISIYRRGALCIICCWVWGYFWTVIPKFPRLTLYKHNSREQGWLIINIMKATCFKSETTVSNDFPPLFVTVFCGIFYPFISIPVSFGTYRSLSYKLHAKALFCLLLLWY